jgi:type I restriction enzyme R subunit
MAVEQANSQTLNGVFTSFDDAEWSNKNNLSDELLKNLIEKTPMFVGKILDEIDGIVKFVRFPGWTNTIQGKNDVEKAIKFIFVKRKLYDIELFNKAYAYVEEYYSI